MILESKNEDRTQLVDQLPEDGPDSNLKRRIVNFLAQRHVASLRRIRVEVEGGRVRLRGRVGSFYEKQLCLNCCQRVAGVRRIDDQIEVD